MQNSSWTQVIPGLSYIDTQDVRFEPTGLVIEVLGACAIKITFRDFRSFRLRYERDYRDHLPNDLNGPVSISTSSEWIDEYKRDVPDFAAIELFHTVVLDLAFVIEVMSLSRPAVDIETLRT